MKNKIKLTGKAGMKITNLVLTVTVMILIPFMVFMLVSSKTDKIGGIKSFVVLSGSMEPKLPVGSVIFTLPRASYDAGDIVSYYRDGNIVTHRIVDKKIAETGITYITKGDANKLDDTEQLMKSQIIGKQVFVIPYIGKLTSFLFTQIGFFAFIIFPIVLFIIFEIYNIKKELEIQFEAKYIKKIQNENLKI